MEQLTDRQGRVLFLRKCGADGGSHQGFRWPMTVGAELEAPDWNSRAECGGGLHGLPWACGDWGLLTGSQWVVFSADPGDVIDIDGAKSKVRRARVEHVGTSPSSCIEFLAAQTPIVIARGRIDPSLLPGNGTGTGTGTGNGYGTGHGDGYGSGYGYGYGTGTGNGDGTGDGDGYGDGHGEDLVEADA